jgi:hypothetical protein
MSLVLDASMALAWIFERAEPDERQLADRVLDSLAEQPANGWVKAVGDLLGGPDHPLHGGDLGQAPDGVAYPHSVRARELFAGRIGR